MRVMLDRCLINFGIADEVPISSGGAPRLVKV